MSPGGTQGAAEGSSGAAEPPVAGPSPTRPPLLEIFCNIPIEEPPSPERCESPCSAMLCECAKHVTATRQSHFPSEPGRRLRAQDNSLKNLNANVPKDENAGRSWLNEGRANGAGWL